MKVIRDRTISNEVVVLDNIEYVNCHFVNCSLRYGGGDLLLTDTTTTDCRWDFVDHAFRTIQFLRAAGILHGDPKDWAVMPTKPTFDA